jgi:hypothetical protein
VRVRDVDVLFQSTHCREKPQADWRGRDVELAAGFRHRDAADGFGNGVPAGVCDQDAHIDAQRAQPFRQHADVVLDAAEHGIVIFVKLQHAHVRRPRL